MTRQPSAVDTIVEQIRLAAHSAAGTIRLDRGTDDGFGASDVTVLEASSTASQHVVRLWDEGQGDFWIEFAGATAAWWRRGRKEASLAEVVVCLLEGRYTIDDGSLTVLLRGGTPLVLASRM